MQTSLLRAPPHCVIHVDNMLYRQLLVSMTGFHLQQHTLHGGAQTFDEMLLLKRGGSVIYNGSLGEQSGAMIAYFESISGVQPISKGYSASSA